MTGILGNSRKYSSPIWHKEKRKGFWRMVKGDHVWRPPCNFCGRPMMDTEKVHYHHSDYGIESGKTEKRLSHARCHEQATHSKVNPFPNAKMPHPFDSWLFYKGRQFLVPNKEEKHSSILGSNKLPRKSWTDDTRMIFQPKISLVDFVSDDEALSNIRYLFGEE